MNIPRCSKPRCVVMLRAQSENRVNGHCCAAILTLFAQTLIAHALNDKVSITGSTVTLNWEEFLLRLGNSGTALGEYSDNKIMRYFFVT